VEVAIHTCKSSEATTLHGESPARKLRPIGPELLKTWRADVSALCLW
jgi:hypothetical protein